MINTIYWLTVCNFILILGLTFFIVINFTDIWKLMNFFLESFEKLVGLIEMMQKRVDHIQEKQKEKE